MRARDEKRPDTGLRKRAAVLTAVIALIALAVGSVFGDNGVLHWLAERERTETLAREVEDLRERNRQLVAQIEALRSDPRAVERIAREDLGLARPGEVVFLLRTSAPR